MHPGLAAGPGGAVDDGGVGAGLAVLAGEMAGVTGGGGNFCEVAGATDAGDAWGRAVGGALEKAVAGTEFAVVELFGGHGCGLVPAGDGGGVEGGFGFGGDAGLSGFCVKAAEDFTDIVPTITGMDVVAVGGGVMRGVMGALGVAAGVVRADGDDAGV